MASREHILQDLKALNSDGPPGRDSASLSVRISSRDPLHPWVARELKALVQEDGNNSSSIVFHQHDQE
jgi:hypothetical protein